jgi:hypothetical protein
MKPNDSNYSHQTPGGRCRRLFIGLLLAGLLTGCVFKRTPVELTLAPRVNAPLASAPRAALELGTFKDTRLVTDGAVLVQKENGFGPTEGAYVTEKPVAEILRDGLGTALEQNGFRLTSGAPYRLQGDIQSSGIVAVQSVVVDREVKFWLTVRFDLVNTANGLTVWHDSYTGQDTATNLNMISKKFVVPACSNMLENAIGQLVADRNFRNYFEAQATNAP